MLPLTRPSLRAPQADHAVVTEPAWGEMPALVARNAALRGTARRLFDADLATKSAEARRELLAAAHGWTARYRGVPPLESLTTERMLLSGHQPQLYHPGVWLKNFAMAGLAETLGATAVHLLIDADTPKATSLAVPCGTLESPRQEMLAMDRADAELPYEERAVLDPALFASFGQRATDAMQAIVPEPLLKTFWPAVCQRLRATNRLGVAIAQARHQLEGAWGLKTLEVPQSLVCDTPSFGWFAVSILRDIERFRAAYNAVLADYRAARHIRSAAQPMPDLAAEDEWLETPFWIWTAANRRRRRLFAARAPKGTRLTDRDGFLAELPDDGAAAREAWRQLRLRGVKIRGRALVTTLFARLLLADAFIHGIGGANYDRAAEAIMQRYFGLVPPEVIVFSGTLHLPPAGVRPVDDVPALDARLRELAWHPERYVVKRDDPRIAEKRRWIATPPTADNARRRCHAIRAINAALQPEVAGVRAELLGRRAEAAAAATARRVLEWREYAFCLFPEPVLQEFLRGVTSQARGNLV